ncbi:MAG TPA: HAD family hydrolase [Acidimicrobiales bacterium]|nr:HAD family hydrolase [Acidimicrobiales bacterium]
MTIEAVIFDWGGTLSEFVDAELVDAWRLAAHHLDPAREEEITARLVQVEADFWATTSSHQRSATLADLMATAAKELGLDVAEALLEEAALRHLDAWTPHIRHDPEAAETLVELRGQGLRIGMLSNTHWPRTFHEHFLERDGLVELIDARLYTSEMPFQKPHPSAFLTAARALGVEAADSVFVGDRPWDDISGAHSAGMRTVLRPNPFAPDVAGINPDARISRLIELLDLVHAWS